MQTYIVRSNKPIVDAALQLFKDPSATKKQSAQSKHDLVNFNNWIFIVTIVQSVFVFDADFVCGRNDWSYFGGEIPSSANNDICNNL